MTNLEIIKYLANHNPTRLAELLDDIYCSAWNCGSYASSNGEGKILEECEIDDFGEWINQDVAKSGFFYDAELKELSKAISKSTLSDEWGVSDNIKLINKAIEELKLLDTIIDTEKYSSNTYNNFRKDVCDHCQCTECLQSKMDIVECPDFENYKDNNND